MSEGITYGPGRLIEPGTLTTDSQVAEGSWIRQGATIVGSRIGPGVFVGFRTVLANVEVGQGVMLASRARVGEPGGPPVTLGPGAWIAARAVVAPGVRVGAGAVVAAGAQVDADVPDDAIVVGRPARLLRMRRVVEDGLPDISPILTLVRRRGTPRPAPLPAGWQAPEAALLGAEFSGGPDVVIGPGLIALGRPDGPSPQGGIRLGRGVRIGPDATLEAGGGLDVGDGTVIGAGAQILTSGHDLTHRSLPWQPGPVSIGADVRIGAGVTVVGPCRIGDRAVVTDHAVVTRDVAADTTTSGILEGARR